MCLSLCVYFIYVCVGGVVVLFVCVYVCVCVYMVHEYSRSFEIKPPLKKSSRHQADACSRTFATVLFSLFLSLCPDRACAIRDVCGTTRQGAQQRQQAEADHMLSKGQNYGEMNKNTQCLLKQHRTLSVLILTSCGPAG